jgi:site-specific recombinase XerD
MDAPGPDAKVLSGITVGVLADDWSRSLRAANKSPRTLETYMEGVTGLNAFLRDTGMPQAIEAIKREHIEAFVEDLLERWTPATASNRYRSLQQFFKWAVAQGEITESPMKNMSPPKLPERRPPVLTLEDFDALLATCTGNGFTERRDTALLWMLRDTGARAAEIMGLRVGDLDRDRRTIRLIGKGNRERIVRYWPQTSEAIDRYLRARRQHEHQALDALWIGERGALSTSGLRQLLERLGRRAGVENVHAHRFRHMSADQWLSKGGSEDGLMAQHGWRSRAMVQRYAAANREDRAQKEHERLAPGNRV